MKLTLRQIKDLYEYCETNYHKEHSLEVCKFICENRTALSTVYKRIVAGIYDENKDPEFVEYKKKLETIIKQYCDRDEQGNIIYLDNGTPQIMEEIVEFNKAYQELNKGYEKLLERIDNKEQINNTYLNDIMEIKLANTELVDGLTPYIVEILGDK